MPTRWTNVSDWPVGIVPVIIASVEIGFDFSRSVGDEALITFGKGFVKEVPSVDSICFAEDEGRPEVEEHVVDFAVGSRCKVLRASLALHQNAWHQF